MGIQKLLILLNHNKYFSLFVVDDNSINPKQNLKKEEKTQLKSFIPHSISPSKQNNALNSEVTNPQNDTGAENNDY